MLDFPSTSWLDYRYYMSSQAHTSGRNPDLMVTSVRIDRERLERFRAVARANQRTVTQQMRWLIDRAIEAHEDESSEAA